LQSLPQAANSNADRLVTDLQLQLIDRLGGHEADHPVRTCDHLNDGRHAILLDPRNDPGEAIARRPRRHRPVTRLRSLVRKEARDLADRHNPLATARPAHLQAPVGLPATQRLDRDLEHLCRQADANGGPGPARGC